MVTLTSDLAENFLFAANWAYSRILSLARIFYLISICAAQKEAINVLHRGLRHPKPLWSIQELSEMWSDQSLPLLPCPLWPGVVVPVRIPSLDRMELFNHLLYLNPFNFQTNERCWIELLVFDSHTWNHLTVCKWVNNVNWLGGWLFGFYGIWTFVCYLTPSPFSSK